MIMIHIFQVRAISLILYSSVIFKAVYLWVVIANMARQTRDDYIATAALFS